MLLRSILGITTAMSLTLPTAAFAQSDARETVRDVLDQYGYDVAQMEMLTTSQIAEIYLTATSDGAGDIRTLLSGMDLSQDMSDMEMTRSTMIDDRVEDVLATEGYDPAVIDVMTDAEVVQIYLSATSEDTPNLAGQLAAMGLPQDGEVVVAADAGANIDRIVTDEMQELGYSQAQIDTLSEAEIAEVYLALTSEDATAVQNAIEGALAS
jgi:hypothetical protein